jgi:alpha-galactosidase
MTAGFTGGGKEAVPTQDIKVVLIGAGSQDFGVETVSGLMRERATFEGATVVLVDTNPSALDRMARLSRRANDELGANITFEATTERRDALVDADFVVISVEVDRMRTWRRDWEIPNEHGFGHVLGENGGPGGLSHSLRTVPLVVDICRDVEELAPEALVINYSNPMSRVCLAVTRYTGVRTVGLCHGFFFVYQAVGRVLGHVTAPIRTDEARAQSRAVRRWLDVQAAGINHLTFITSLRDRRTGADLYPKFRAALQQFDPNFDPISRRVDEVFGLYPIQGDTHVGEYFGRVVDVAHVGPPFEQWAEERDRSAQRLDAAASGAARAADILQLDSARDDDRAIAVMAAIVEGRNTYEHAVNVVNDGCIEGLPEWAVVEVPGVVGAHGVRGLAIGSLPPAVTEILNQQIAVQDRVVEAAVHGDRRAALQALWLDPATSTDALTAERMLSELLATHSELLLPRFRTMAPTSPS